MRQHYTTERLVLDKLKATDAEFIQILVNTTEWIRFIGDRNIRTLADADSYIEKILNNPTITYWVVKLKAGLTPIGIITFIKREYLEHYDIGFAFLPAFSKKGYAYEASKIILDNAVSKSIHPVVLATTLGDNTNSIQLLLKLGLHFQKEIEFNKDKLLLFSTAKLPQ